MHTLVHQFKSRPLHLKWFILLILLRPVIDTFWWVKDSNPLLSPLNWTGVIPVLLIASYFVKTFIEMIRHKQFEIRNSMFDIRYSKIIIALTLLLIINAVGIIFFPSHSYNQSFIQTIGISVKLISFPLFLLYLYTLIPKTNFDFVLKVFLLSTLFPFFMIIYELLFGPFNPYTPGGRMFERYRGLYADGINYTIYWLIGLITSAYFYLKAKKKSTVKFSILAFVFSLSALSLFYLHQAAAYFIFGFMFILILIFVYKKNKLHFLTLTLSLTLTLTLIYLPGSSKLASLFQVDAEVIKGNIEIVHGANGRVWIWLEGLTQLFDKPFYTWFFGAGLSDIQNLKYFSAGAHSDYIRILFTTGIIGLLLWLLFLLRLFKGFTSLTVHNRFLLLSTVGSLLLFSVTHTPTFYLPFIYFVSTVLAYTSKHQS